MGDIFKRGNWDYIKLEDPSPSVNPKNKNVTWLNAATGTIWVCVSNVTDSNVWISSKDRDFRVDLLAYFPGTVTANVPDELLGLYPFSVNSVMAEEDAVIDGVPRKAFTRNDVSGGIITFNATEDLRFIGAFTVGLWLYWPAAYQGRVFACSASGESLASNILLDLAFSATTLTSQEEYSAGTDIMSSITGRPPDEDWCFFVASRQSNGLVLDVSWYLPSTGEWTHKTRTAAYLAQKAHTANLQQFSILGYSAASGFTGKAGAIGLWGRYMAQEERIRLKDGIYRLPSLI